MWRVAQFCYIQKYINEGVVPSEAPVLSLFEMMVGSKIERLDYAHDNYDKELSCFYYGSGAGYLYSTNSAGNVTGIYIHGNMEIRDTICIPKYIYHLKFLRELSMIGCFIDEIPKTIGQLKFLKRVNLESNSIRSLPRSMKLLPNLIYLELRGNSVSKQLNNHNIKK